MMPLRSPKTYAALVGLVLAAQAWPQAGSLTFEEALTAVHTRNEALMAAQDDVQIQAYERAAAKGLRYPKVELEARHTILNDPVQIGIAPIPFSLTLQDEQFDEAKVSASLPLYAGGRIDAANRAAEAQEHEAQAQGRKTEEELVTQLAERYFGCCLARSNVDVQGIKVRAMEKHAYQAQRLMEEGIIARVEYLNAKVALANACQEKEAAERDVSIVREGLANVVVSGEPVMPASGLFLLPEVEPLETFQGFVEERHPVLAMLDAKENLAKQGVRAEEGAGRPTLYLFGMHELVTSDLTALDPEWAVGLGLQYTLFDGFQGKNKAAAARTRVRKVNHMQDKIRRDLKSLVVKRYEEMEKAREQYDTYGSTLELASENLRVRLRAFEEGVGTSLEVVDATLSQARAQLGRLKAAFDFDLAFFQLLETSGRSSQCLEYLARAVPVTEPDPATAVDPTASGAEEVPVIMESNLK